MGGSLTRIVAVHADVNRATRELELVRERVGWCHPEVARCLSNLGVALMEVRRLAEAEQAFREGIAVLETADEADGTGAAAVYCQLAVLLQATGRLDEAERLFRRALDNLLLALGPDDEMTLDTEARHTALLRRMQLPN